MLTTRNPSLPAVGTPKKAGRSGFSGKVMVYARFAAGSAMRWPLLAARNRSSGPFLRTQASGRAGISIDLAGPGAAVVSLEAPAPV